MAMISIYGLSRMYEGTGTIFDELALPTQFTDPTVITDRLLLDTMELEVLYPDPDVFKGALGIYSKSRIPSWQKLADDMYYAYDPFINFTRDETRTVEVERDLELVRTADLTDTRTANLTDTKTLNLTDERTADLTDTKTLNLSDAETKNLTDTETKNLANGNTKTTSRNAWNGTAPGTLVTAEQESNSGSETGTDTMQHTGTDTMLRTGTDTDKHTGTDTMERTGTDTDTHTGTDTMKRTGTDSNTDTGTITTTETFHSQGDSAMYTPTDIARKEWELRAEFSVIEYIVADIKTHFCLMVY